MIERIGDGIGGFRKAGCREIEPGVRRLARFVSVASRNSKVRLPLYEMRRGASVEPCPLHRIELALGDDVPVAEDRVSQARRWERGEILTGRGTWGVP